MHFVSFSPKIHHFFLREDKKISFLQMVFSFFFKIEDIELEPLSEVSFIICLIFWILLLNSSIISAFIWYFEFDSLALNGSRSELWIFPDLLFLTEEVFLVLSLPFFGELFVLNLSNKLNFFSDNFLVILFSKLKMLFLILLSFSFFALGDFLEIKLLFYFCFYFWSYSLPQ